MIPHIAEACPEVRLQVGRAGGRGKGKDGERRAVDIRKLEVFRKVYELRSFSRAGDETYLSQPTVSGHVKFLEDYLGCRLFDRLGKEVVPTRAGDILYEYAVKIIELRDDAERALNLFQGKMKGTLLIGGSTIPGGYVLPTLLGRFHQQYPDVMVSLKEGDTRKIVEMVVSAEVEIGMVGALIDHPSAKYHHFGNDRLILVAPPGCTGVSKKGIKLKDLSGLPFIMREHGSGTRMSLQRALQPSSLSFQDLNIVAEMGSTQAVKEAVKNGLGVSILSDRAVVDELRHGLLEEIPVEGLEIGRKFYLVIHRSRTMSPICSAFWDFCLNMVEDI